MPLSLFGSRRPSAPAQSAAPQAAAAPAASPRGAGLADLLVFALSGSNGLAQRQAVQGARAKAEAEAAERAALAEWGAKLEPMLYEPILRRPAPAAGQYGGMGPGVDGAPISEPEPELAAYRRRIPTFEEAAPLIGQALQRGWTQEANALAGFLDKAVPNMEVHNDLAYDPRRVQEGTRIGVNLTEVNGRMVNPTDPRNEGQFYGEPPVKGAEPIYDKNGREIGWRMADGSLQAIGDSTYAETAGRTQGTMYRVPQSDGTEAMMTGGQYLAGGSAGAGGPGGAAVGVTQNPAERAGQVKHAEGLAIAEQKAFDGFVEAGRRAGSQISTLSNIHRLIGDLDGGKLTPLGTDIASAANSLGVKLDPRLGNKEAAVALTRQLTLDRLGGSLGAGFSNADREYIDGMSPNQAQSAEGRRSLIETAIAAEHRRVQVAKAATAWRSRFGRLDAKDANGLTFEEHLQRWAEKNRLFRQESR